jgi:hypothetical protein
VKKSEASEIVAILASAFPSSKAGDGTFRLYEKVLLGYDYEAIHASAMRLLVNARWLPTLAEIIEGNEPAGGIALEQWGHVGKACAIVGSYQPMPTFRDPVTAHCVDMMGWKYLCTSPNEAADRARFVELYNQVSDRDRRELRAGQHRTLMAARPRPLPTLAELSEEAP